MSPIKIGMFGHMFGVPSTKHGNWKSTKMELQFSTCQDRIQDARISVIGGGFISSLWIASKGSSSCFWSVGGWLRTFKTAKKNRCQRENHHGKSRISVGVFQAWSERVIWVCSSPMPSWGFDQPMINSHHLKISVLPCLPHPIYALNQHICILWIEVFPASAKLTNNQWMEQFFPSDTKAKYDIIITSSIISSNQASFSEVS